MNSTANGEPLHVNQEIQIEAVNPSVGYFWLGFLLSYADNILDIIFFNFTKKN